MSLLFTAPPNLNPPAPKIQHFRHFPVLRAPRTSPTPHAPDPTSYTALRTPLHVYNTGHVARARAQHGARCTTPLYVHSTVHGSRGPCTAPPAGQWPLRVRGGRAGLVLRGPRGGLGSALGGRSGPGRGRGARGGSKRAWWGWQEVWGPWLDVAGVGLGMASRWGLGFGGRGVWGKYLRCGRRAVGTLGARSGRGQACQGGNLVFSTI